MIEMRGATHRNLDKDAYDFIVTVDSLQIRVANSLAHKQELAQRVGELAMTLAVDFLQQLNDTEVESDGA